MMQRYRKQVIGIVKAVMILGLFLCGMHPESFGQTRRYMKGNITGNRQEGGVIAVVPSPGSSGITLLTAYRTPGYTDVGFNPGFYYGNNLLTGASTDSSILTASRTVGVSIGGSGVLALAGGNVYIQFRDTANRNMPPGRTIYFSMGRKPLSVGLAIPIGGLLSVSSSSPFEGSLYYGAGNYTTGATTAVPSAGTVVPGTFITRLLLDKFGNYYCGITSVNKTDSFNSARLKVKIPSDAILGLSITNTITANIRNAFYFSTTGTVCSLSPMFATRGEVNGISLDLGAVLPAAALDTLISNPHRAIDGDTSTYATFSRSLLSAGLTGAVTQSYIFDHQADSSTGLRVYLSVPPALLTATLLDSVFVDFYRNDTLQTSRSLGSSLLTVDLLGLPLLTLGGSSYNLVSTVVRPSTTYDRATIRVRRGLLSLLASGGALNVHEVSLAPAVPRITAQPINDTACSGTPYSFSVTASGAASYLWQEYATSSWSSLAGATTSTYGGTATTAISGHRFRVRITGSGSCPQSIFSNSALLIVRPTPSVPSVTFGP